MRDVQVLGEKREKNKKNNKNYLLKNNLNNFRGNQLPAAASHGVNKYINPIEN